MKRGGSTPLLVLGSLHSPPLRMLGLEWTWYPSGRTERAAPRALISLRPHLHLGKLDLWLKNGRG